MIQQLSRGDVSQVGELIRKSFGVVAKQLGLTRENCPRHTSFLTDEELLEEYDSGWLMFGLYEDARLVGFMALHDAEEGLYVLKHLAVLPEYQRSGYGKALLDFCKAKANELGAWKIFLSIIEENTALKHWYIKNGFVHTGTKRFAHLPFTVGFMEWEVPQ